MRIAAASARRTLAATALAGPDRECCSRPFFARWSAQRPSSAGTAAVSFGGSGKGRSTASVAESRACMGKMSALVTFLVGPSTAANPAATPVNRFRKTRILRASKSVYSVFLPYLLNGSFERVRNKLQIYAHSSYVLTSISGESVLSNTVKEFHFLWCRCFFSGSGSSSFVRCLCLGSASFSSALLLLCFLCFFCVSSSCSSALCLCLFFGVSGTTSSFCSFSSLLLCLLLTCCVSSALSTGLGSCV